MEMPMTHQHGGVLAMVLVMLIALMLLGASGARLALQGDKAGRALRDRKVAMQAAEAALADGERELAGAGNVPERAVLLAAGDAFAPGCGDGLYAPDLGLCGAPAAGASPAWQVVALDGEEGSAGAVPYGQYTGEDIETGQGFLPFRKPRYIIEQVPLHDAGAAPGAKPEFLYRVTAIGFDAHPGRGGVVVLQSVSRVVGAVPSAAASAGEGGGEGEGKVATANTERLAWQELANWRELHHAAKP